MVSNLLSGDDLMLYPNLEMKNSDSTRSGIITMNSDLHPKNSVSTPPSVGPMDPPMYTHAVWRLRAIPRSRLLYTSEIIDTLLHDIMAVPNPVRAR